MIVKITLGQIAYEAYCKKVNWKSIKGDSLPDYVSQSDKIKSAWEAAAKAVLKAQ